MGSTWIRHGVDMSSTWSRHGFDMDCTQPTNDGHVSAHKRRACSSPQTTGTFQPTNGGHASAHKRRACCSPQAGHAPTHKRRVCSSPQTTGMFQPTSDGCAPAHKSTWIRHGFDMDSTWIRQGTRGEIRPKIAADQLWSHTVAKQKSRQTVCKYPLTYKGAC